jgi:hypothetical protein
MMLRALAFALALVVGCAAFVVADVTSTEYSRCAEPVDRAPAPAQLVVEEGEPEGAHPVTCPVGVPVELSAAGEIHAVGLAAPSFETFEESPVDVLWRSEGAGSPVRLYVVARRAGERLRLNVQVSADRDVSVTLVTAPSRAPHPNLVYLRRRDRCAPSLRRLPFFRATSD